jgi:hypothetical protein
MLSREKAMPDKIAAWLEMLLLAPQETLSFATFPLRYRYYITGQA